MPTMDPAPWMQTFPALMDLEPEIRGRLAAKAQCLELPRDAQVFRPGDESRAYLLVLEGTVKVSMLTGEGREVLLYRVGPGEACLLTTACLLSGRDYAAEARCETEVRAVAIPSPIFQETLDGSSSFRAFVFELFSRRLGDLMGVIDKVAFQRIDRRLAAVLLQHDSKGEDPILLTHQALATELGTAREVVSRQLKTFERAGWVRLGRGEIRLLDRDLLRAMAQRD